MGPFTRFTIECENDKIVPIDSPSTYGLREKYRENDDVIIHFKSRDAFLFPDPGEEYLKKMYIEL